MQHIFILSEIIVNSFITEVTIEKQDQKSIDAIERNLISEPNLIIDDNIIEELPDGCTGPVVSWCIVLVVQWSSGAVV